MRRAIGTVLLVGLPFLGCHQVSYVPPTDATTDPSSSTSAQSDPTPTPTPIATPTPAPTPQPQSANGTTIPSATQIVDANGNVWTVSGGQIYRNGVVDPPTKNVILLLYYSGAVYQENSENIWYTLNTSTWPAAATGWTVLSGDPEASPSGTTIGPGSQIVEIIDIDGNVWTVNGGQIYRNGVVDPDTNDVTTLLYYNDMIYQLNVEKNWYDLNTTNWPALSAGWTNLGTNDPRTTAP